MNILVVAATLPYPPASGGRIRLYNLLKQLSGQHRIELVCLVESEAQLRHLAALEDLGLTAHAVRKAPVGQGIGAGIRRASTPAPRVVTEHASAALGRLVSRLVREHSPDLIQCDQIEMAQYAPKTRDIPALLVEYAIESELCREIALARPQVPARLAGLLDAVKLRRYERRMWPRFDGCVTVSEADAAKLRRRARHSRVWVVPNGVDTAYFAPDPGVARGEEVVMTGTIGYYPNLDGVRFFLGDIWPRVRALHPQLRMTIVGATNAAAERLLGEHPGVTLTGQVPDVRPYVARAKVFVVPLRIGGGTRLKILEALAQGIPVVTTSAGCEGLEVAHGEHLLIADDAPAFAQAVSRLLADRALWERLASNGRRLVTARYDWASIAARQDKVYASLTRNRLDRPVVAPRLPATELPKEA